MPAMAPVTSGVIKQLLCRPSMGAVGTRTKSVTTAALRNLPTEVVRYGQRQQTGISLKALIDFGRNRSPTTLLHAAQFLHNELPVRLAHRICDLETLPYGLAEMPSVKRVQDWYIHSFDELRSFPRPATEEQELEFTELIGRVKERHNPTLITIAKGVMEFKEHLVQAAEKANTHVDLGQYDVHEFLDRFYMSRIGIRILIGQHVALHEPPRPDYVGLICTRTSAANVARNAIEDARFMCYREYGVAPDVVLHGKQQLSFSYVPGHLHHLLFEVLKNSMRAVAEKHGTESDLPPVRLIVADHESNEDVVIKISDEGGGIPRSGIPRIWSYFYTTAAPEFGALAASDFSVDAPLAGLGYGLPLSRLYARYFGGDLQVISMEGYGTDAYIYLKRVGDAGEPLADTTIREI